MTSPASTPIQPALTVRRLDHPREWGYVALSRGRTANHLYLVDGGGEDSHCYDQSDQPTHDPIRQAAADLRRSRGQHLAIDQTGEDLRRLSDQALRENLADLRAQLTASLSNDTHRRHEQLRRRQQELVDQRTAAEQHLHDLEGRPKRRRRRHLTQDGDRARAALDLCDRNLAEVGEQLQELRPVDDETASGVTAQRFEQVATELDRRAQLRARAAEFDPPVYVASVLGRLPESPKGRDVWRAAVLEVGRHRLVHGVDDPHLPLGERTEDPAVRRDHDRLATQLHQTRRELLAELTTSSTDRDLPALEHAL